MNAFSQQFREFSRKSLGGYPISPLVLFLVPRASGSLSVSGLAILSNPTSLSSPSALPFIALPFLSLWLIQILPDKGIQELKKFKEVKKRLGLRPLFILCKPKSKNLRIMLPKCLSPI